MMADSTANFYLDNYFNAVFDITWSFQYSVTGLNASGGFATFLFKNNILQGGSDYESVGVLPEDLTQNDPIGGIDGHVLSIIFKSNNTVNVYNRSSFSLLTSFSLAQSLSPFVKTYEEFNTIRFNLTNVSETLNISVKNKQNNRYETIASINTGLTISNDTFYKIGFSYSTPLTAGGNKCLIKLKDIHVQGKNKIATIDYGSKPFILPKAETYYLIQSPTSGLLEIKNEDPNITGYILHKKS
jgi:hypothetical protein